MVEMLEFHCEAYSHGSEDIKSENTQIIKAIETVMRHLAEKELHAMDRGGDRGRFYKYYLDRATPINFVIRLKERDLLYKGKRKNCADMALCLPNPYDTVLIIYEDGKEKRRKVQPVSYFG